MGDEWVYFWPVLDEHARLPALIREAEDLVDDLAAGQGVKLTGAVSWRLHRQTLVARAPAEPIPGVVPLEPTPWEEREAWAQDMTSAATEAD
jgi:hypothetical protein